MLKIGAYVYNAVDVVSCTQRNVNASHQMATLYYEEN